MTGDGVAACRLWFPPPRSEPVVNSLERSPLLPRWAALGLVALAGWPPLAAGAAAQAAPAADRDREVAALVAQLGDEDWAVRETASARLTALGPAAADALLTAAETSGDLEVALRARWLVESLPLVTASDPAEVAAILEPFATSGFDERVRIMHRLLRLDDDAGIEPLARVVRLERTPAGSRIAAALLVREWQPGDPYWPVIAPRILAGIDASNRPTARILRGLVAATTGESPEAAAAGLDEFLAGMAAIPPAGNAEPLAGRDPDSTAISTTERIFRRCAAQLLARAGRRKEAGEEAARLLAAESLDADGAAQVAFELEWLAAHGLPEAVEILAGRLSQADLDPLLAYAAAVAWRASDQEQGRLRAAALARQASRRLEADGDFAARLRAAMILARWGADDWAEREYRGLLEDRQAGRGSRALAAILGSEFLHDRQRHGDAAALLRRELDEAGAGRDELEAALMQIERDPRAVRARMLYFEACAAAAAGDPARQRQQLEAALRAYPKEIDTLIGLFNLADNTPAQQEEAATRVARGLAAIADEIRAVPEDGNARNEYAWLVANTTGDVALAIEHSKASLEQSFDSGSYLDTLAHCQAAAGDLSRAVRTQWLAARQEPHSQAIRRNLERFRAAAAEAASAATPVTPAVSP
jgi:hypothetical protein